MATIYCGESSDCTGGGKEIRNYKSTVHIDVTNRTIYMEVKKININGVHKKRPHISYGRSLHFILIFNLST